MLLLHILVKQPSPRAFFFLPVLIIVSVGLMNLVARLELPVEWPEQNRAKAMSATIGRMMRQLHTRYLTCSCCSSGMFLGRVPSHTEVTAAVLERLD